MSQIFTGILQSKPFFQRPRSRWTRRNLRLGSIVTKNRLWRQTAIYSSQCSKEGYKWKTINELKKWAKVGTNIHCCRSMEIRMLLHHSRNGLHMIHQMNIKPNRKMFFVSLSQ